MAKNAKARAIPCRLPHVPETHEERKARLRLRRWGQERRTGGLVFMTQPQRSAQRRARKRGWDQMMALFNEATLRGEKAMMPPPFVLQDGIRVTSKYIPAGPRVNVTGLGTSACLRHRGA